MTGTIKNIPTKDGKQANYAFIKGDDGNEYFLHASELQNAWADLKLTVATKKVATLEFESVQGLKGLRAAKARLK